MIYGLLHDIGHGPYSHLSEELCKTNHNQHGSQILGELRPAIESCNGDFDSVERLLQKRDPLSACVSQTPAGTDKMDYLNRDAWHTSQEISLPTSELLHHCYFHNGQLVIDRRIISAVMLTQKIYTHMYNMVYGRKACRIISRFLQKMIELLLQNEELTEAELLNLDDNALDVHLANSRTFLIRQMWGWLRARRSPKVAVVISPANTLVEERVGTKSIALHEAPSEKLEQYNTYLQTPRAIAEVEATIADIAGIPDFAVAIALGIEQRHFVLPDIPLYDLTQQVGTLKTQRPAHYASLQEDGSSQRAVRVCVLPQYREQVADLRVSTKILEYLLQHDPSLPH